MRLCVSTQQAALILSDADELPMLSWRSSASSDDELLALVVSYAKRTVDSFCNMFFPFFSIHFAHIALGQLA